MYRWMVNKRNEVRARSSTRRLCSLQSQVETWVSDWKKRLSTLHVRQYLEYIRTPRLHCYCIACGKLLLNCHYFAAKVEMHDRQEGSYMRYLEGERNLVFELLRFRGHWFYLGLLSIGVYFASTVFAIGMYFICTS